MASESSIMQGPSSNNNYLNIGGFSSRSRSSGSSTSSLSSTFSELSSSTSSSSSSPPNSKTNAFFASPFSTRPPSPFHSASPPASSSRSITVEFFATPVQPLSPPQSSSEIKSQNVPIHSSRIFPSRYTSIPDRSQDFNFLDFDRIDETSKFNSHQRAPSTGSDSSFTSSFQENRLPTPPPTAPITSHTLHREDTMRPNDQGDLRDEPTPRPADMEPPLLRFERSMLLEPQSNSMTRPQPLPLADPSEADAADEEAPHPGSIISLPSPDFPTSHLPLSPLSLTFTVASPVPGRSPGSFNDRQTPTPTNESSRFGKYSTC